MNYFISKVKHDIHFNLTILSDIQLLPKMVFRVNFLHLFLVLIRNVFDEAIALPKQHLLSPVIAVLKMANTNVQCDFTSCL